MADKRRVTDLAVFGGMPSFQESVRVGRPNIGDRARLIARIQESLDTRWLTNDGPYVRQLEREVVALTGVKHCIAVCNATVGLEIAIRATGMHGAVIVPSFTFVASPHALQWLGIRPVFADVDPDRHTLDPAAVERAIGPGVTGILGVHLWGRACDTEGLEAVARRHRLRLVYDAAHAFGCSHRGRMVGNFGSAEVFSFHATKFVNSFEGGAVVTNDDAVGAAARMMRNFGLAEPDVTQYVGTNGKMSEIAAAMGLTSLEALDEIVKVNQRNHRAYGDGLAGLHGVRVIGYDDSERCNFQYVVTEIDGDRAGLTRDELQQVLAEENVVARRYFSPGCHRMEPYRSQGPAVTLPNTEHLADRVLCFPTGTAVDEEAVGAICSVVRTALAGAVEVRARLRQRAAAPSR